MPAHNLWAKCPPDGISRDIPTPQDVPERALARPMDDPRSGIRFPAPPLQPQVTLGFFLWDRATSYPALVGASSRLVTPQHGGMARHGDFQSLDVDPSRLHADVLTHHCAVWVSLHSLQSDLQAPAFPSRRTRMSVRSVKGTTLPTSPVPSGRRP
jgi:hypothetical protein